MKKYIDAEKLKAEIERMRKINIKAFEADHINSDIYHGRTQAINHLFAFIDSSQQEQPEAPSNLIDADAVRDDFVGEIYRVLDADPTNDRANAIINAFDSLPTIQQEQPEVDLEKFTEKMNGWKARYNHPDSIPIKATMAFTARMFYQYPNVARQWYEQLPNVTMD